MKYFLLVSAFLSVVLGVFGIYILVFAKGALIKDRLRLTQEARFGEELENGGVRKGAHGGDSFLTSLSRFSFFDRIYEKNKQSLTKAQIPIRPEELFGIAIIVAGTLWIIFYLFSVPLLLTLPFVFIGYRIPSIYVAFAKMRRAKRLNDQLPEALSILSNGLRAGLSFTQSMIVAVKEMDAPISEEFNKIVRENSLGKALDEALSDFSKRTEDEDIDIFVTAIQIQRQVGGNLSEILDILANTIRDRIKLKGDIKTITAQSKLSAVVIGGIPIALMVILGFINPEFVLPLFNTLAGNLMLAVVVLMQSIGIVVLIKILKVKI